MADTPEVSDPFLPPSLILPQAEPFIPPEFSAPNRAPTNQGPRTYRFDAAPNGALAVGQGEIQVLGPSFVRLNILYNAAGTIFAPAAIGVSNTQCLWLNAFPKGWGPSGGSIRNRQQGTIRGSAPLIWLPHAGTWVIELVGERLSEITGWEVTVIQAPGAYLSYVGTPAPTRHAIANGPIPANTALHIGTFLGLSGLLIPNWFEMVALRVKTDNPGAGAARIAIGGDGTIGQGEILNALTIHVYSWQELAGASVWFSNSDLVNQSESISVEAHFL